MAKKKNKNNKSKKNNKSLLDKIIPKNNDTVIDEKENLDEEELLLKEISEMYTEVPHSDDFSENDFANSVESLSADEIAPDGNEPTIGRKKRKKKKLSPLENAIQFGLIGICGIIAIVCAVMLVQNIYGKIRGNEIYSNTDFSSFTTDGTDSNFNHPISLNMISSDKSMLSIYDRIKAGESNINQNVNSEYSQKLANMKASLTALKQKNSDIYGWIYVEGTNIDYPILRGTDNDYYLDHAYTGESLPIGSIFVDYHTQDTITDNYNTVIYGHNVVTGAMFHDVTKFLDADFFKTHKLYIYTMDGVFIYEPVAIYPTKDSYFYYRTEFVSESDFLSFAAEMVGNSSVASGKSFVSGDTMITLSTCVNNVAGDGRYALHAKLVEVIK